MKMSLCCSHLFSVIIENRELKIRGSVSYTYITCINMSFASYSNWDQMKTSFTATETHYHTENVSILL